MIWPEFVIFFGIYTFLSCTYHFVLDDFQKELLKLFVMHYLLDHNFKMILSGCSRSWLNIVTNLVIKCRCHLSLASLSQ